MATVTFLVHPDRPDALALATDTAGWLTERGDVGAHPAVQRARPGQRGGHRRRAGDVDLAGTTVAVSMGGDGTFLRVVRLAATEDVPVLGVNFGRLGYLPDLLPDQVRGALTQGLRGQGGHRGALRARRGDLGPFPRRWHHGPAGAQRGGDREDRLRPHRPPGHHGRRRGGADLFGRRPHHRHPDRLDRLQPLRRRPDPGADAARHGGDARWRRTSRSTAAWC